MNSYFSEADLKAMTSKALSLLMTQHGLPTVHITKKADKIAALLTLTGEQVNNPGVWKGIDILGTETTTIGGFAYSTAATVGQSIEDLRFPIEDSLRLGPTVVITRTLRPNKVVGGAHYFPLAAWRFFYPDIDTLLNRHQRMQSSMQTREVAYWISSDLPEEHDAAASIIFIAMENVFAELQTLNPPAATVDRELMSNVDLNAERRTALTTTVAARIHQNAVADLIAQRWLDYGVDIVWSSLVTAAEHLGVGDLLRPYATVV